MTIGNYVSIAENVYFLLDVEHYIDHISTYPFRVKLLQECKSESFAKGNIVVEDDVWIGFGAVIMSGVTIGKGAHCRGQEHLLQRMFHLMLLLWERRLK